MKNAKEHYLYGGFVYLLVSINSEDKGIKRRVYKTKDVSSSKKKLLMMIYIILMDKKILKDISNLFLVRISSFLSWSSFFVSIKFIVVITKASIDHSTRLLLRKSRSIEIVSNK